MGGTSTACCLVQIQSGSRFQNSRLFPFAPAQTRLHLPHHQLTCHLIANRILASKIKYHQELSITGASHFCLSVVRSCLCENVPSLVSLELREINDAQSACVAGAAEMSLAQPAGSQTSSRAPLHERGASWSKHRVSHQSPSILLFELFAFSSNATHAPRSLSTSHTSNSQPLGTSRCASLVIPRPHHRQRSPPCLHIYPSSPSPIGRPPSPKHNCTFLCCPSPEPFLPHLLLFSSFASNPCHSTLRPAPAGRSCPTKFFWPTSSCPDKAR